MEEIGLEDVWRSLASEDPSFVEFFLLLAEKYDQYPAEIPRGAATLSGYNVELEKRKREAETQDDLRDFRVQGWEKLEGEDNPLPLPDRFFLYEIIEELTQKEGVFARESLLEIIREMPIRLGPWRGFKRLFKATEQTGDLELYGALLARIDTELSQRQGSGYGEEISRATLAYLARRGWRRLRRLGESFPAVYVENACAVLAHYGEDPSWYRTWVAAKIFRQDIYWEFHEPREDGTDRAFAELWRVSPTPLLNLLGRARSGQVQDFAIASLKKDFRIALREVSVNDILRLHAVESAKVHTFLVWLLENSPRFEQGRFRELGLHEAILDLLESPSSEARQYGAKYAEVHGQDLPLSRLLTLARSYDRVVLSLVEELLSSRDPREEIGLDAWSELLGIDHFQKAAKSALKTHFGSRDLTVQWFFPRLLSENRGVRTFSLRHFPRVHEPSDVERSFFLDLLHHKDLNHLAANLALDAMEKQDLKEWSQIDLQLLLLRHFSAGRVFQWMDEDRVDPRTPGLPFLKALGYSEPQSWNDTLRELGLVDQGPPWVSEVEWDEAGQQAEARRWLGDRRYFGPNELPFSWLITLVESSNQQAKQWAREYLLEAFRPADFSSAGDAWEGMTFLWELAAGPESDDGPRSLFARQYFLMHHQVIGLRLMERPLEEEERISSEFLSLERLEPALVDRRHTVRHFALTLARQEFARWAPSLEKLLALSESRRSDLRELIAEALLTEPNEENEGLLLSEASLSLEGVFAFCNSSDQGTRAIGLALIEKYPQFAVPHRLIGLSDSPDRRVRAFVIRTLWSLYRHRGITAQWKPPQGNELTQRPEAPPSDEEYLRQLMRRILFAIPPARFPKDFERTSVDPRPVPARKEKLYLLELMEELAREDRHFGALITPLLSEFAYSLGTSERRACLVSLARIEAQWPELHSLSDLTEAAR